MGERLLCKQEVIGSIPFTSTTGVVRRWPFRRLEKDREIPSRDDPGAGCCLKGKERVCNVTEADRLGPAGPVPIWRSVFM